jgi:CRISPR-associated protein Cmr6
VIPLTRGVAALVGEWADGVENRSLLHEKFALPKVWGVGDGHKLNDAGRWSVLRIVTRGSDLLQGDSQRLRREAGGRNVQPDVAQRKERESYVAQKMAGIAKLDKGLISVGNENARRFLADLERSFNGMVATFEATLGSRMMVNLAGGVIENAGISLDRCFGMPVIPGSAIKGITRVQALWEIKEAKDYEKRRLLRMAMLLFGFGAHDMRGDFGWAGGVSDAQAIAQEAGAQDFKGCACFLPAYPTTAPTLVVDMVNPHYPEYYSGKRQVAEDNESPIPNYFPAVEAGSAFGFAVMLNRVPILAGITRGNLLGQVKQWLERAVTRKGVGAKTAAGYGWFELGRKETRTGTVAPTAATSAVPGSPASPVDQLVARFKNLNTKDNFAAALPQMAALTSDADLRSAFEKLVPASERGKLRKGNPYWQAFTSGKAGADGQKILARLGIKLN